MGMQITSNLTKGGPRDVRSAVASYRAFHDDFGGTRERRTAGYQDMVRGYYDLVTDFYEKGWGESFHFAPRKRGEPFARSIDRHQHYLALRLGLARGEQVLDVGCGVGGPMREIAQFSGAHVTGVNVNAYQAQKARSYNGARRLDRQCRVLEADFMRVPLASESVDAVYAIEATCHAPDLGALLCELYRLLRPGGRIAIYEWCLTTIHDPRDVRHLAIKRAIEEGNGLPDIRTTAEVERAFQAAGFSLIEHEDRAGTGDPEVPWYHSLAGRELSKVGVQRSALGRAGLAMLIRALEATRVAPKGSSEVQRFLSKGADALVAAGELGTFTPMAFFLARKP